MNHPLTWPDAAVIIVLLVSLSFTICYGIRAITNIGKEDE